MAIGVRESELWWVEDFLYAGSSSLLLTFLNLQFPFSPIYLLALIPYFYRLTQVGTWRSIFLGLTLATSFVMIVSADNLVLAPANLAIQLVFFNIVFVSYGVAVSRARDIFGINPLLLFFLWLPLEYCFRNFGFSSQFYALTSLEPGQAERFLTLLHLLLIPLALILLNPLLLLAARYVVKLAFADERHSVAKTRRRYYVALQYIRTRSWYYFPDLLSPPNRPIAIEIVGQ